MNVYMSLWTKALRKWDADKSMWKLSLALANKHYGKVHLISDKLGCEFLNDLPFASFSEELENIPNFPLIWCLGKIYAYNIASQNGHFLHLDGDVFLWESLPENLINSDIFAQSPDNPFDSNAYKMDAFKKIPEVWEKYKNNSSLIQPYNMGIFGGKDINNIKKYCEFVLSIVNNPQLKDTWDSHGEMHIQKNCLIEQGNLGIFLYENNLKINTLLKSLDDKENLSYKKYSHLMMQKESEVIRQNITKRLNQNPYDLEPKNVPIEQWNKNFNAK